MLSAILIPLDGSPLAEQVLLFAEPLARAAEARVILARVIPPFSVPETTIEAGLSYPIRSSARLRYAAPT